MELSLSLPYFLVFTVWEILFCTSVKYLLTQWTDSSVISSQVPIRFGVLTEVPKKITVSWVVELYRLVSGAQVTKKMKVVRHFKTLIGCHFCHPLPNLYSKWFSCTSVLHVLLDARDEDVILQNVQDYLPNNTASQSEQ